MTLRFDWYPECNDELIITRAEIIIDNISKRNIKKSTIAKLKKTTNQILSALYLRWSQRTGQLFKVYSTI